MAVDPRMHVLANNLGDGEISWRKDGVLVYQTACSGTVPRLVGIVRETLAIPIPEIWLNIYWLSFGPLPLPLPLSFPLPLPLDYR